METWDVAENIQPGRRVAADLDLRLDWPKRVECLVEQVAHNASLRLVASRADVVDRQIVINTQVTLDKPGHLPVVRRPVKAFQHENVTPVGRTTVAFTAPLLIGVCQRGADSIAQGRGVACLGSTDAVCQTSFFHAALCRTA
jgi:hypothetical protein